MTEGEAAAAGRWLIGRYQPCALFALKPSSSTSSVGRTLLVPTPYAIKMALVDAAFRAGVPDDGCARLLRELVDVAVRIAPPTRAVVTHTFLKVRQEPKERNLDHPYISSVAYRELVHHQGTWRWAFEVGGRRDDLAARLAALLPHVRYIGKRGSFVQYLGVEVADRLDAGYTQAIEDGEALRLPMRSHVAMLDDFGPDADLPTLSSYSVRPARAGRHRRFVNTLVPLGVVNVGPGFTEYRGETG